MIHMGVARKWHFSTLGGAANVGGVSGDLFEHHGSGILLLGITSLNRHFCAQIDKIPVLAKFGQFRFQSNFNSGRSVEITQNCIK